MNCIIIIPNIDISIGTENTEFKGLQLKSFLFGKILPISIEGIIAKMKSK
jgi:hypothetical protein